MNVRERFLEVIENFNTSVDVPKWEFGYWGETIDNWYEQGLPKKDYPKIPKGNSSPSSSLYSPCWESIKTEKLPVGIGVLGGGLYCPTQCFPLDIDVRNALNMDKGQMLIDVNLLFHPMFETKVIEENDDSLIYIDIDGVKRIFSKSTGVLHSKSFVIISFLLLTPIQTKKICSSVDLIFLSVLKTLE